MKKLMIMLLMVVATSTASFAKGSNDNVQTAAKEVVLFHGHYRQACCCQEWCVQGENFAWYVQRKHAQGNRNQTVS